MTRTNKILAAVVAVGLAVGAFYFLALAPKREEIAKLDTDVAAKEAELTQAQQMLAGYEQARKTYRSNYTTLARLGKAVPVDDDVQSLIVQLESAADRSGVDFEKIELGSGLAGASGGAPAPGDEQSTGGELAAAPGAVPVAGGAMSAMPFSFTFNGSYFDLSSFMSKLEHFVTVNNERVNVTGRLLRLESVAIVPVPERLPADAGPDRRGHVHRAAGRAGVRRRGRRPVGAVRSEQHPGHDQRERRSRTMNVVTSTWHQLVNRRLWPVAVVLLVALVAIPVVLARDPEAAEVPAPAPVGGTNVDDSLATPVVAEAASEDGDRRRRVLGVRKDPFKPAPVKTPEPTTQQATAPNTGGSPDPGYGTTTIKPPSFPGSSGGSMPSMPSPLPYPIRVRPRRRRRPIPPTPSSCASATRRATRSSACCFPSSHRWAGRARTRRRCSSTWA